MDIEEEIAATHLLIKRMGKERKKTTSKIRLGKKGKGKGAFVLFHYFR